MKALTIRPKKMMIKLFGKRDEKRLKTKIDTISITHLP